MVRSTRGVPESVRDTESEVFLDLEREYLRKYKPDFEWMEFETPSPRTALRMPLSKARVALVSTAGAHLPTEPPQGATGNAQIIPIDSSVVLTHPGYDTERATTDPEVVWPVGTLQRLATEGVIGELSPNAVATMGGVLIGQRIIDRAVPVAVKQLQQDRVDLALIVPACPVCQQSVGLLQRGLDGAGIATVSITQVPRTAARIKPSLSCFVAHPFGLTFGAPGDTATHEAVATAALREAEKDHSAGTIVRLPFTWHDDLRKRQLHKQAL